MATKYVPRTGPIVTRSEAKSAGLTRYFTGEPCLRGHLSDRMVSNSRCMMCFYALRKYPPRNDQRKAKDREWVVANGDRVRARKRAWYARNAPKIQAQNEGYRKKAPDKGLSNVRNYRARKRSASGRHSVSDIVAIMERQNGKCAYCRKTIRRKFDVDHIKPLALGGSNAPSNLQMTCQRCNRAKGAIDPIAFAQTLGRLL